MDPIDAALAPVLVAVGAVVENVSTVEQHTPPPLTLDDLKQAQPDALRVLITLRDEARVLGGLWELPGGKIERNESPTQAVVRELREEVGIQVQSLAELPAAEHIYDHATVRLLPFVCSRVSGLPQLIDVTDARWVRLDELADYTFPQASLPVLKALRGLLA